MNNRAIADTSASFARHGTVMTYAGDDGKWGEFRFLGNGQWRETEHPTTGGVRIFDYVETMRDATWIYLRRRDGAEIRLGPTTYEGKVNDVWYASGRPASWS